MSKTEQTPAFELIADADTFKDWLAVQLAVVDEARWHTTPDELRVRAVEPGQVSMVEATFDPAAFEQYEATEQTLGIGLTSMENYVDAAPAGDIVKLTFDPETRFLNIRRGPTDFTMALIDPESMQNEPDIPDLDLPAEVTLSGKLLSSAVKSCQLVSDHTYLNADPVAGTFEIRAEGDTDDVTTEYDREDLISIYGDGGPYESLYSIDYFEEIVKPIPDDAEVTIHLGEEFPFHLEYEMADGAIAVTNMLAPRIQSD